MSAVCHCFHQFDELHQSFLPTAAALDVLDVISLFLQCGSVCCSGCSHFVHFVALGPSALITRIGPDPPWFRAPMISEMHILASQWAMVMTQLCSQNQGMPFPEGTPRCPQMKQMKRNEGHTTPTIPALGGGPRAAGGEAWWTSTTWLPHPWGGEAEQRGGLVIRLILVMHCEACEQLL